jgi:hypothetical protein
LPGVRVALVVAVALAVSLSAGGCLTMVLGGGGPGPTDFVTSKTYTKWVIEVDSVQGQGPPSGLLDFVKGRLGSVADKPDGIEMRVDESAMPGHGSGSWSIKDIEQTSDAHQGTHTSGNTAVLHLLFLDGHSEGDSDGARVLGSTLTYSSGGHVAKTGPIAIFSQSIKDSCTLLSSSPCTDPAPIWRAVLVHEFGHAMGLVNNGIPMVKNHEASTCNGNPDHKHSANTGSVMNCSVESGNLLGVFGSNIPNDYDGDDRADLHAAGGK